MKHDDKQDSIAGMQEAGKARARGRGVPEGYLRGGLAGRTHTSMGLKDDRDMKPAKLPGGRHMASGKGIKEALDVTPVRVPRTRAVKVRKS